MSHLESSQGENCSHYMAMYWLFSSTSWCPSHSCRNVRILPESTRIHQNGTGIHQNGTGIHWNGTGIHRNPQEWDWILQEWNILNKIAYIYIYLYLLNSLHIYKYLYSYVCIYWSAFIYLNYCLVPFNIMNLQGLEMHGDTSRAS